MMADEVRSDPRVAAVRQALARSGGEAWVVGGTIRDALLGREIRDVDVVVGSEPEAVARTVARALDGPVFPLSEEFGGWRVVDRSGDWVCDVTPLAGPSIDADLRARDFTVNAVAASLSGGSLIDPTGGLDDLAAGRLRALPGAFEADPLRALRLARLATELPLRPDPATERAALDHARALGAVSGERVFSELRRIVCADRVLDGLELLTTLELMPVVLPEVAGLRGVEQSQFHHLDVHGHTIEVVRRQVALENGLDAVFGDHAPALATLLDQPLADGMTRREALRLGALLHDIGKPATRSVLENGRVTFIGHDSVGADQIRDLCERLHVSRRLATFLAGLARAHLALGFLVHARPLSPATVFEYLRFCEPVEVEVTVLSCADRQATRGENAEQAITVHLELAGELIGPALAWRAGGGAPAAPLRGDDLADALGVERGPRLGELLAALSRARYAGEIETADEAIQLARRLLADESDHDAGKPNAGAGSGAR